MRLVIISAGCPHNRLLWVERHGLRHSCGCFCGSRDHPAMIARLVRVSSCPGRWHGFPSGVQYNP